jgi:hypothetical protein
MEQHATYTISGCNIGVSIKSNPTSADYRETVEPLFIIKVESDAIQLNLDMPAMFRIAGEG